MYMGTINAIRKRLIHITYTNKQKNKIIYINFKAALCYFSFRRCVTINVIDRHMSLFDTNAHNTTRTFR